MAIAGTNKVGYFSCDSVFGGGHVSKDAYMVQMEKVEMMCSRLHMFYPRLDEKLATTTKRAWR